MYAESVRDPDGFWGRIGRRVDWIKEYTKVKDTSFAESDFHIRWFYDGKLNVSSNCLDRHLATRGDKTAIIWEGDDPAESQRLSYRELHERVCQCANALKSLGVMKGDRVTIYLPMIPEIAIAMLACARIGAIHSVVFAGFSSEALGGRIADCALDGGHHGGRGTARRQARGPEAMRRWRAVRRGHRLRQARAGRAPHRNARCRCTSPATLVLRNPGRTRSRRPAQPRAHGRGGSRCSSCTRRDRPASPRACCTPRAATSSMPRSRTRRCSICANRTSTGPRPTSAGSPGTATSSTGPLCNGATTVMFEGVPNYPDTSRFWQVVDKHQVTILYSSPTAIRSLMREGEGPVKACSRKLAAAARLGRRADQPGSLGVVPPRRRRRSLPDRRHLVADRDRRHLDHAAARRHRP